MERTDSRPSSWQDSWRRRASASRAAAGSQSSRQAAWVIGATQRWRKQGACDIVTLFHAGFTGLTETACGQSRCRRNWLRNAAIERPHLWLRIALMLLHRIASNVGGPTVRLCLARWLLLLRLCRLLFFDSRDRRRRSASSLCGVAARAASRRFVWRSCCRHMGLLAIDRLVVAAWGLEQRCPAACFPRGWLLRESGSERAFCVSVIGCEQPPSLVRSLFGSRRAAVRMTMAAQHRRWARPRLLPAARRPPWVAIYARQRRDWRNK